MNINQKVVLDLPRFTYTGFNEDWWSVGWQKWKFEHKLADLLRFPNNHLGEWIKAEAIASEAAYLAYKSNLDNKPVLSPLGRQWDKFKQHALSLKDIWVVNTPEAFDKVRDRAPAKFIAFPGKQLPSYFTKKWVPKGPLPKRGKRSSSLNRYGGGPGYW